MLSLDPSPALCKRSHHLWFLRWRSLEARRWLGWFGLRLGFGLGLVHPLFRENGVAAVPEQLVLRLPRPAWVPALTTIDDAEGPMLAVAGDTLRLALDEVAAARELAQRA